MDGHKPTEYNAYDMFFRLTYWGRVIWTADNRIVANGPKAEVIVRLLDDMRGDMSDRELFDSLDWRLRGHINVGRTDANAPIPESID